jgi:hypothetical protein
MRSFLRLLFAAILVVAATVACASSDPHRRVATISGSGTSSTGQTAAGPQGQDEFTRCMKDNGAEPQQVQVDGGSGTVQHTAQPQADQRKQQQQAMDKCRRYLPNGGNPQPMRPEQLEQARAIAKCMRAAGVPYPDPDPNAAGGEGGMPIPSGVNYTDPAVQAKLQKCSRAAGVGSSGTAPSTPGR